MVFFSRMDSFLSFEIYSYGDLKTRISSYSSVFHSKCCRHGGEELVQCNVHFWSEISRKIDGKGYEEVVR